MADEFNPDEVLSVQPQISGGSFNPDEDTSFQSQPQKLRIKSYGPIEGEYSHATTYGPVGNKLEVYDAAVSPNVLDRHPLGSWIDVDGRSYRVGDVSYVSAGRPNFNTIEIRDRHDLGHAEVRSLSGDEIQKAVNEAPTRSIDRPGEDRKSTRLNSSHSGESRMPSSA